MTAEYHDSTVTNMEMDKSGVGYSRLVGVGDKLQYSVFAMRNSPFKTATIGLGLLCVILLAGVIGQSVHYQKVKQTNQDSLSAVNDEKQKLQKKLNIEQTAKNNLENTRKDLQQVLDMVNKRKDTIQTNNNILTEERNTLKLSESQLKISNSALSRDIEQLKVSKEELETTNIALNTAKALIQNQFDSVLKSKTELQARHDSAIRDRDHLQNKVNIVTRAKEQLQANYNSLITRVEHWQDRYNSSTSEKDKLEDSHKNLTMSKETLQAQYDILVKAIEQLNSTYWDLVLDNRDLESNCDNNTLEKDLLQMQNENLTAERDDLQAEVLKLKSLIPTRKCPTGWTKFQYSCYYTSTGKKTWSLSRAHCQTKGADLAIIRSDEEMTFINGLYSSDKEVWIGLTDEGIEGQWTWVDGKPLTKSYWGQNQPNSFDGRNQDCVEFWHRAAGRRGDWNDENCNIEQQYICEM